MARVSVDVDEPTGHGDVGATDAEGEAPRAEQRASGRSRRRVDDMAVEIEREVTKRHLIEAITSIVVVVLYMAFTLVRDRESGVVVLDESEGGGPEDDWAES